MFNIKGEGLQQVVQGITNGAKKAKLKEARVFVSSKEENIVKFYFVGEELQVEKTLECETTEIFQFATTIQEIETKVGALPDSEIISVVKEGDKVLLKWGRSSNIRMDILPELSPEIEIPIAVDKVTWLPGKLHMLAKTLPPFAAVSNSEVANSHPVLRGLYFGKEESGAVIVRATNRALAVTVNAIGIDWFEGLFCSIPIDTILGLLEILPSDSEITVSLNEEKTLLVFEAGYTKAVSRILSGDFPAIDNSFLTSKTANTIWRVDRLQLLETARRIKRVGPRPGTPAMIFRTESSKAFVELAGVLVEQIGASVEGDAIRFVVNSDYLETVLTLHRSEEVLLYVKASDAAITVLDDSEVNDIRVLVSPMLG